MESPAVGPQGPLPNVQVGVLRNMTFKVPVNHLASLCIELHNAADAAEVCTELCSSMCKAVARFAPILCKLVSWGAQVPNIAHEHRILGVVLHRHLWNTADTLSTAKDVLYEYVLLNKVQRWKAADSVKRNIANTSKALDSMLQTLSFYVPQQTHLKARQGASAVLRAVIDLEDSTESIKLKEELQNIHSAAAAAA